MLEIHADGPLILYLRKRQDLTMLKIAVIDGQGGRLGALTVAAVKEAKDIECEIYAIGTNSIATSAMMKAGADFGATGENSVKVVCRDADYIVGPIGIVSADSLLGEITPDMAVAIGQSRAVKFLIPINQCNNRVVGVQKLSMSDMIKEVVENLRADLLR